MLDEQFNQVNVSLLEHYSDAKIDKNCFVITKKDLTDGNLKENGIVNSAYKHLNKF